MHKSSLFAFFAMVCVLCSGSLAACLWDYDTVRQEVDGKPDTLVAILGGFAQNPPLFYEMRLERVSKMLADNPDDLDAYDAAAVACDRLGRPDDAIEWMAKKAEALERLGYNGKGEAQPNHRYRYLANLGTFHAHRWIKNGANREEMADIERARELIAQAIEENPDAHFGREKYQLMLIEWAIKGDRYYEWDDKDLPVSPTHGAGTLPTFLAAANSDEILEEAEIGLVGLITQGVAWRSVDVFYALAVALERQDKNVIASVAHGRAGALAQEGARSIVPNAPTGSELAFIVSVMDAMHEQEARLAELSKQAHEWSKAREKYLNDRLVRGEHPDTHEGFWSEFDGNPDRFEISWRFNDYFPGWKPGYMLYVAPVVLVLGLAFAILVVRVLRRRSRMRAIG